MESCPLCSHDSSHYHSDKKRDYFQCQQCELVFVAKAYLPELKSEKAEYDLHQNDVNDEGYLRFLSRMAEPILSLTKPNTSGLDFGCGPAPALAHLLEQQSRKVALYDIFYYPAQDVLNQQYDFVTCTEAIEHFHTPVKEWELLLSLLKPNGILGIMTKLVIDKERFASWHYKNDPTHVSFFSLKTFEYLADKYQLSFQMYGQDVAIFTFNNNKV